MDVVYVCRPGSNNEELRYSLRSLQNLQHDRVWIGGSWPRWVAGVETVVGPQKGSRYEITTGNLEAVCRAGVSERFVYMNDDIFVMHPMDRVPVLHRGLIDDVARAHSTLSYSQSMRTLAGWLREQGHDAPLCYELHVPMELERDKVLEVLELPAPKGWHAHKRSLYGNHWQIGGEQVSDFKILGHGFAWSETWPFLSTTDNVFTTERVGQHIRRTFPEPSRYER